MRKLLALLLTHCMLLALCACGAEEPQIQVVQEAAQSTAAATEAAASQQTTAAAQEAEAVADTPAAQEERAEEPAPAQEPAQPEAGTIGTVGGADGPTATYTAASQAASEEALQEVPDAPVPAEPAAEPEAPAEEAAPAEPEEAVPAPAEEAEEVPAEPEAPAAPTESENPSSVPEVQETDAPAAQEPESVPVEQQISEPAPAEAPAETGGFALSQVTGDIYSTLSITDAIEMPAARLLDLYGLQAADYTDASCFVTMAGIFPHEVVLVKAVDETAAARLAEKLENRLNEVRNQSASYDPENYALAQECSVDVDGLYVSMFLSPDHAAMRAVLEGYLG